MSSVQRPIGNGIPIQIVSLWQLRTLPCTYRTAAAISESKSGQVATLFMISIATADVYRRILSNVRYAVCVSRIHSFEKNCFHRHCRRRNVQISKRTHSQLCTMEWMVIPYFSYYARETKRNKERIRKHFRLIILRCIWMRQPFIVERLVATQMNRL